jgi:hypothetical protein
MSLKSFLALIVVTYGTMLAVFGCGRTDSPTTYPTVPITVATVVVALPSNTPTSAAPPPATTTIATAHDALQADLAQWDVLNLLPADTKCREWLQLAMDAGWPADPAVLHQLGAVIWKESRCQNVIPGHPHWHSWDTGLLQINQIHGEWITQIFGMEYVEAMSDPWRNLHFGWRLWEAREADGKCGWKPWSIRCS